MWQYQTKHAVDWANANSIGHYCVGDVAEVVDFIEDNAFDGAFSYAALYHLPHHLQCKAVLQAIRVVKPGGFIYLGWFGWHDTSVSTKSPSVGFWAACLKGSGVTVQKFAVINEVP
jgi:SAM-dependent methyltransferase